MIYHKTIGMNFIIFLDSRTNNFCFIFISKVISLANEPGHHKSVHYRALSEGLYREKVLIKQFN
jgi:hypothetical protein